MAVNVLLPTQQIHQVDNSNSFANHQRAVAYSPNESIPFQVNPADNLKFATEAIGAIDKWQEQVRKDKEDALVTKASNTFIEAITQRKNEYTNLQGENAVNGFEQYTKDIDNIQKQFSKVFKNTAMQGELNKQNERNSIGARLDGKNWHDKQVYTMQEKELLAQADLLGQQFITNLDSPTSKLNEESLGVSLKKYLDFQGIPADSAQRVIETQKFYYNAFKSSLLSEIKHNPAVAMRKLDRVKHLIGENKYKEMLADAKEKAETDALRALNKQNMLLERQERQNRLLVQRANEKFGTKWGAAEKAVEKAKTYSEVYDSPEFFGLSDEEKDAIAENRYNRKVLANSQAVDELTDDTNNAKALARSYIKIAIDKGTWDSNNPTAIFGADQRSQEDLVLLRSFCGGEAKLIDNIKAVYDDMTVTPSNSVMAEHLKKMDYDSFVKALDGKSFDEYLVGKGIQLSQSDKENILTQQEKNRLNKINGVEGNKLYNHVYDKILVSDLNVKESQKDSSTNMNKQVVAERLTQMTVDRIQRSNDFSDGNVKLQKALVVDNSKKEISNEVNLVEKNADKAVSRLEQMVTIVEGKEDEVEYLSKTIAFNTYRQTGKILQPQDIADQLVILNDSYQDNANKFIGKSIVRTTSAETPNVVLSEEAEKRANRTDREKAMDLPFLRN